MTDDDLLNELRSISTDPKEWTRAEAKHQRDADSKSRACTGKAKHDSEQAAKSQAKRITAYMDIYECRWCQKWHVGNPR